LLDSSDEDVFELSFDDQVLEQAKLRTPKRPKGSYDQRKADQKKVGKFINEHLTGKVWDAASLYDDKI